MREDLGAVIALESLLMCDIKGVKNDSKHKGEKTPYQIIYEGRKYDNHIFYYSSMTTP